MRHAFINDYWDIYRYIPSTFPPPSPLIACLFKPSTAGSCSTICAARRGQPGHRGWGGSLSSAGSCLITVFLFLLPELQQFILLLFHCMWGKRKPSIGRCTCSTWFFFSSALKTKKLFHAGFVPWQLGESCVHSSHNLFFKESTYWPRKFREADCLKPVFVCL